MQHVQSTRALEVEGPTWAEIHILIMEHAQTAELIDQQSVGIVLKCTRPTAISGEVIALVNSYFKSPAINCTFTIFPL